MVVIAKAATVTNLKQPRFPQKRRRAPWNTSINSAIQWEKVSIAYF